MNEEAQSQDELQVVGYTTEADGVRYTANSVESVNGWKGQAAGDVVPVVLKSEADAKIKELSDMVMSLFETQKEPVTFEDVKEFFESHPAGTIDGTVEAATMDDVVGHKEVVTTVLNRLVEGGISKFPIKPDVVLLPVDLDQNTRELVVTFTLALSAKLLAARQKYGYTDGWRHSDWYNDCLHELKEHIEKGDPRDVAAFCAFMWYHGWSTNGNSHKVA